MSKVSLKDLSDLQKTYLTQLSYLDFNWIGIRRARAVGVTVSNAKQFLLNPDIPFCGTAMMDRDKFNKTASVHLGDYLVWTDAELLDRIVDLGLGNVVIVDVESDPKSGFQATIFKDNDDNLGISFRGSDLDFSQGGLNDWIKADFLEYFTNDSDQRRQALDLFSCYKRDDGNNYIYGHSLGGNLTSHVFAEYHDDITEAFTINGYPINESLLNTQEKLAAFNSDKYNCNSISGDIVSHLKSQEQYKDNVNFVKNNEIIKSSLLSAHLVQSASFDDVGNFIIVSEEEMLLTMGKHRSECANLAQTIRTSMNDLEDRIGHLKIRQEEITWRYKEELLTRIESVAIRNARVTKVIETSKEKLKKVIDRRKTNTDQINIDLVGQDAVE